MTSLNQAPQPSRDELLEQAAVIDRSGTIAEIAARAATPGLYDDKQIADKLYAVHNPAHTDETSLGRRILGETDIEEIPAWNTDPNKTAALIASLTDEELGRATRAMLLRQAKARKIAKTLRR